VTIFLKRTLVSLAATATLVMPDMATAQRSDDRAQFDARMNMLERVGGGAFDPDGTA
jgi:hypothetical protein